MITEGGPYNAEASSFDGDFLALAMLESLVGLSPADLLNDGNLLVI